MQTVTSVILDHDEEAVYLTQSVVRHCETFKTTMKLHPQLLADQELAKRHAANIAHEGFLALMHNHVGSSLSINELLKKAKTGERVIKYNWEH